VAVEPAGVEGERHAGSERELADRQPRARRRGAHEPGLHLVRRRRPHRGVVERGAVAFEEVPRAVRGAGHQPPAHRRAVARVPADLGRIDLLEADREHLPEPRAGRVLEHRVAARPEPVRVQRGLELEPAPVHGRGEPEDVLLDAPPEVAVFLEVLREVGRHARSRAARAARRRPPYTSNP
jgi:hypothetical protein